VQPLERFAAGILDWVARVVRVVVAVGAAAAKPRKKGNFRRDGVGIGGANRGFL